MRRLKRVNMKSTRLVAVLMVVVLALTLFAFNLQQPSVHADSNEVAALKKNLETIQSSLKQVENDRAAIAAKEQQLTGDLAFLQTRSEQQRELVDEALEQKQFALMTLEEDRLACIQAYENLENKEHEYGERIALMFDWKQKSLLEILFSANDIEGVFSTLRFMKMVTDADEEALDELNAARALAEVTQADSEEKYQASIELLEEADRVLSEIKNQTAMTENSLAEVQSQLTIYRQKQEQLKIDVSAAQAKLDAQQKLEREKREKEERERKAREEAAKKANKPKPKPKPANPGKISTGMFVWPTPGYYFVTSHFGWREWSKSWHQGVDIGAPTGACIVAMAAGTVIACGSRAISGNYIYVDHGGGIVTRYYHLSRIACHMGQKVSAGQLIGYVGSTGRSTGPHLHFEVRVNGSPVNGLKYFR